MKTKLIIISILCLHFFSVNGQNSENIQKYRMIKFAPTSLMNPFFPAIQFSFEHNIMENQSLQYELGGIFLNESQLFSQPIATHNALVEYRWYRDMNQYGKNKYQGVGFRFQKQYSQDVEFIVDNGLLELTTSLTTTGLYYTRGRQWKYEKLMMEFGSRLGMQHIDYSVYNLPEGVEESQFTNLSFFSFFQSNIPFLPIMNIYFKVGFGWESK